MLNKVIIMGRFTRDPELKATTNGTPVVSFTLACDRDVKRQDGTRETDFLDCVAWDMTAEFVGRSFRKGSAAVVEGRVQRRKWTDKDGNSRTTLEILAERVYFASPKLTHEDVQTGNGYKADGNQFYSEEVDQQGELPF